MTSRQMACSSNHGKFDFDGLWKSDDNKWILTCLHGSVDGELSLEWNSIQHIIGLSEIRNKIYELTSIRIPENELLTITPCYPKEIKKIYKNKLIENNIKVEGNWNDSVHLGIHRKIKGSFLFIVSHTDYTKFEDDNKIFENSKLCIVCKNIQ
jgi:hypothetical protein